MHCSSWIPRYSSVIRLGAAASVLIWGMLLGSQTQAGVIYTEDFETLDGSGNGFSRYGWNAGYGSLAVEMGVSSEATSHIHYGYCRTYANQAPYSAANAMAWTTEPAGISTASLESISFDVRNSPATTSLRVAVKIGDDWFATNDTFTSTSWTRYTFDWTMDAAKWRDMTYHQGVDLILDEAVRTSDLPSGNLSAFGFFTAGPGGSMYAGTARFDNIEISIVPEPSSLVLLSTLAAMVVAAPLRRPRQRA